MWHLRDEQALRVEIQAALARARETDKRVLLEFGADWCPDCNEVDPFMPADWKVGDDIPKGAYIPPSVKDQYDADGNYIGEPIEGAEDAPESQSILASLFTSDEAEATEETTEETTETETDEATDVV